MTPMVLAAVVNFDSGKRLEEAVGSLLASGYAALEIVVVDNASPAPNGEVIDAVAARVRVIRKSENVGFGRACNEAARASTSDYLVFLNPDVVVTPGWLTALVDVFERDPLLAIASPTTLYPDELRSSRTGVAETATVPGCALMVRRSAWDELGGFDPAFFLYWEDTDLCWRAWNAGWRVVECFDSVVCHERGGSSGAENWAGEQIRNGIRTHVKNMRWRVAVPFFGRTLARTVVTVGRSRRLAAVGAWTWNLRALPDSLAERRAIRARRAIPPETLERLVRAHRRRQLGERAARSASGSGGAR